MTDQSLKGQVVWITGSSRGLGRAMAEELSRMGAKVAVHGTHANSPRTFYEGGSMEELADKIAETCGSPTMAVWGDGHTVGRWIAKRKTR